MRIFAPAIAATFKRSGVFQAESVFIFKVVGEERRLIAPAKLVGSGFAEINFSQMTRGVAPLSVVPWTDNQKVFMRRIMKLEPRVGFLRAKQVFLIPEAADEKGGDCGLVEMPLHATGAPELIVGRVLEKSNTGGEFVDAIALGGGCERGGAEKEIVGILVERRKRVFFGAFHSERVVVAVSFAESAIVKEIVAHPDVNHRSLGRDGFYGGVWINAGGHGEKTRVGDTEDSHAAVVVRNVLEEPVHGVISIGAFVNELRIAVISHRTAHDESALRFEAAANILENKNVTAGSELRLSGIDGLGRVPVHAIGSALHEEGKRSGVILGAQDDGVKLDAVAHGDHDFLARVFDLVKWERLIADLARVLATLRGAGAVVTFHNDAVEADYFSVCGAKELELHGNI